MEAPEKIYVSIDPFGYLHAYDCENHPPIVEEYVRKDAIIEKVCKFLDDRIKHDSIDYPMATVHLIEDFKNYMKGE